MSKTYDVCDDDFWKLINKALMLFANSVGVPNGAYTQQLITSKDSIILRLTEVTDLKLKGSDAKTKVTSKSPSDPKRKANT